MPHLNNQSKRTLQLSALRTVRIALSSSYKHLIDEESRIISLLPSSGNNYGFLFITGIDLDPEPTSGAARFHVPSLAETTIARYGGNQIPISAT